MPVVVGSVVALAMLLLTNADRVTIIAVGIPLALWSMICVAVESKAQRDQLSAFAKFFPVPYTKTLDYILKALPRLLRPPSVSEVKQTLPFGIWRVLPLARDADDKTAIVASSWSWPVFDLAIRAAIIYPLTLELAQHALLQQGARFGNSSLIGPNAVATSASLLFAIALFLALKAAMAYALINKYAVALIATAFLLGAAFLGMPAGYIALCIFAGFAVFLPGLIALALIAGLLFASTFFGGDGWTEGFISPWGYLIALTLCALVAFLTHRGARPGLLGYLAFITLVFASFFITMRPAFEVGGMPSAQIRYVLLPTVNALFDWLSYGATIWLIVLGQRKGGPWPLILGLVDCAIALILFAAVGLSFVTLFGFIEAASQQPLVQISVMLETIKYETSKNYWIVAMATSTLLPTFLHLCLGLVSIMTWLRAEIWNWFVDHLDPENHFIGVTLLSSAALTALSLAYIAIPTLLIYLSTYLFWGYGGRVRVFYLDRLADFATWAGFS